MGAEVGGAPTPPLHPVRYSTAMGQVTGTNILPVHDNWEHSVTFINTWQVVRQYPITVASGIQ